MGSCDHTKVTIHELDPTDLETLLYNFGSKLIDAVAVGVGENVVNDTAFVGWGTMLAQMLDAPVAELTMGDEVDACNDFLNGGTLKRGKY